MKMAAVRSNQTCCNSRPIAQNHRSILLENFRENRCPDLQLNQIVSHMVEFATDRDGSEFIQRKLDDVTENHKEVIYQEMKKHVLILMKDAFGNLVVTKFLEIGTQTQRIELFQIIRNNFAKLCEHKYGCLVVQKFFCCVPPWLQVKII